MDEDTRLDLKRRLRQVYNKAWVDEAFRDRLIAEPRTVLVEHGITLPATVNVEASSPRLHRMIRGSGSGNRSRRGTT